MVAAMVYNHSNVFWNQKDHSYFRR